MPTNIICETPSETIRIARFLRPDVRPALYDGGAIADTSLYKELQENALTGFPKGGTLILNFGLIDWFPTSFYQFLIQALHDVRALDGKVLLCCLSANVKEGFELMGGPRLFEVHPTEARAIAAANK